MKDFCMRQTVLLVLLFICMTSYSQNRIVKGRLISPTDYKLSGGLVEAEPSMNWAFIGSLAKFNIECNETDTALTFHLFNRTFNHKINTTDSYYKIEIDTIHSDSIRPLDNNEGFQLIISEIGLPMLISDHYFINNKGMWVSDQNMTKDSISSTYYPVDTAFIESIKENIEVITDSIVPESYYNNNVDDGQQIIISILYKGELFEYTFQMYYNDLVNNLIVNINSKVKESDRIEYEWTKKFMKE
jgi:hypothetical protein